MSEAPRTSEEAVELFLAARRRGEPLTAHELVARHPELGDELREALEALELLERTREVAADEELPQRIGPYRVVRELGRGGMGVVLEALEEPLGRRVALKVLPPEFVSSPTALARFRREAALAARLEHEGLATVYGAGLEGERPWIAMRYVEGRTLAQSIAAAREEGLRCARIAPSEEGPRDPLRVLAACAARLARALAHAHEAGIVHRDVKPSNVIVAPDGRPVLLDFGLALADGPEELALTRSGDTAGTPAYLAPEIVGGERARCDAQGDVYALGVTLYECLVLRRPFDGPTPAALFHRILSGSAPALRSLDKELPRDLAVIVETAMERERGRRYASAAALAADLEAFVAGRPISARPLSSAARLGRWARREPRQALLAGLLFAATLVLAGLGGSWWRSREEVRAAADFVREQRYEQALQAGFGMLSANWHEEAEAEFLRALAMVPDSTEALVGRALQRMQRRREGEAVELLSLARSSPAVDALRRVAAGEQPPADLGAAWLAQAAALELFVDGVRLNKQIERSRATDRRALSALALSRFEEAVARSPKARMLYAVQRALAARAAGDPEGIRSAAGALAVLWPDQGRALFTAGLVLSELEPEPAAELLERTVQMEPSWGAAHQVLANVRFAQGDLWASERALRRALELDPKDADAWNTLGLVLDDGGCPELAREAYLRALASRPMAETWANLGLLELRAQAFDAAEVLLRAALDGLWRECSLRTELARLLARRGASGAALHELEVAVGFDPSCAGAWSELARLRLEREGPAAALRTIEAGLAASPDDPALVELREEARRALERGG